MGALIAFAIFSALEETDGTGIAAFAFGSSVFSCSHGVHKAPDVVLVQGSGIVAVGERDEAVTLPHLRFMDNSDGPHSGLVYPAADALAAG